MDVNDNECPACQGTGFDLSTYCEISNGFDETAPCPDCDGTCEVA